MATLSKEFIKTFVGKKVCVAVELGSSKEVFIGTLSNMDDEKITMTNVAPRPHFLWYIPTKSVAIIAATREDEEVKTDSGILLNAGTA